MIDLQQYNDFLLGKRRKNLDRGFDVSFDEINPLAFDFQKYCIQISIKRGRNALFENCGLGKTIQQLEWAKIISTKTNSPVLIVAPLSVSYQTSEIQAKKFGYEVNQLRDNVKVKSGINIINYDNIGKLNPKDFSGIVLDESSILKNFSGSVRNLIINFSFNIHYRLACTATPSPNDYTELGNHAEFLGVIRFDEMLSEYFIRDSGNTSDYRLKKHSEKHFWEWVSSWAIAVNKPSDIGFSDEGYNLPKLNINIHKINHNIEANDGELFFQTENIGLIGRRKIKKETVNLRVDKVKQIIDENPEDRFLIWCHLNEESSLLKSKIKDSVEVTGSNDNSYKEKSFIDFSNNKIQNLITKPSMAGFGMNFQNTNNQIFVGINDSFEQYYQCICRQYRFGQKKEVNVNLIISEHEESVLKNMLNKIKDHENFMNSLTKNLNAFQKDRIKSLQSVDREEYKTDNYTLIRNDSIIELQSFEENSIDYSIFSIPFLDLFIYSDSENDMGNNMSKLDFYKQFRFLAKQLIRVLKEGRNISIHCMMMPVFKYKEGYVGIYDFRGELIRLMNKVGFHYFSEVTIWKDPVVAMQRTKSLRLLYKQLKKDSSMSGSALADYLLTFKKPGENKIPITHESHVYSVDKWQQIASPIWNDINQGRVLSYSGAKEKEDEKHICPLQLDVIERGIELYSNPGEVILDPFNGIGSTTFQSLNLNRKSVGIELKKSYWEQSIQNMMKVNDYIF